ncbi:DUF2169 domain-containing protein [Desulfonatronum sp. SC1]|uniref:DUF2169 family type VI secretion system accessory protein n=1 Tax=Desulfonatronum sp. SC1 TaxID=2109626 RepID=UPI000D31B7E9|nr:DUF2169 domain-containing protein [Desulfonatronum sp. SC1]PTN36720.1 hypothetical protein C6366_08715 [Desulfonatronum sp. SC1]
MKVFKDKTVSPLFRPIGIGGETWLCVAGLVFFDLLDPDALDTEQNMWAALPGQLGQPMIIDQVVPKPRGEVLVSGACFQPDGVARPAHKAGFRVGGVRKEVAVFGERFWSHGGITDPKPFVSLPLSWEYAFGGEGFERNPLGRGAAEVVGPDGAPLHPLPNIEHPARLIGAPTDRPEPACFGPVDQTWPQRKAKAGTYDDAWLKTRWPWFPDDMNYEYFNQAQEDQFLADGFFHGGEQVEITGMHPRRQLITTHLPRLRLRTFVTLDTTWKPHQWPPGPLPSEPLRDTDEFREITTHLETVWLFPSLLRGLLIFRGMTRIRDESLGDAARLLLALEDMGDGPKSIEHYRDELARRLHRGADIDMAPFEQAKEKLTPLLRRLGSIPKEIDDARQKALGNRPSMPLPSTAQFADLSAKLLADGHSTLNGLEAKARELHARFGHATVVDLTIFDRFRAKLGAMDEKVTASLAKADQTRAKLDQVQKDAVSRLRANMPQQFDSEKLKDAELALDDPLKPKSLGPWHDAGFPLLVEARRSVDLDDPARTVLKKLGFESRTWKRHWFGATRNPVAFQPRDWGVDQEAFLSLPPGLWLPRFDGKKLISLRVRPFDPDGALPEHPDRDVVVPGSDPEPLFLPAATLIDLPGLPAAASAPVVVAGDPFAAIFLEQEIGDCCSILTLASPAEQPGKEAAQALQQAEAVLVVLPETAHPDGRLITAWRAVLPMMIPAVLPKGSTVFEAHRRKQDVRGFLLGLLPPDLAEAHRREIVLPEPGKPPSGSPLQGSLAMPDLKAIIPGVILEVRQAMEARMQPLKDEMEARQAGMMQRTKDMLRRAGQDPSVVDKAMSAKPGGSLQESGEQFAGALKGQKESLRQAGQLTPERASEFDKVIADITSRTREADAKFAAAKQELAAKKQELEQGLARLKAMEPPEEAKAKLAAHGLDPDKIRPLTREEVMDRHARGESLSGAILSGVDLSNLDLTGADLTMTQLTKTKFTKTILDKAVMIKCMAGETDFSGASLRGADLGRAVLRKASFAGADLQGVRIQQAVFRESDLSAANLSGMDAEMAVIEKSKLKGARLDSANLRMCILADTDLTGATFAKASMARCLVNRCVLDRATFREATLNRTMFQACRGEKVVFSGANMDHARTAKQTDFSGADLTGASLRQASLRDTDFHGASFAGANLDEAIVENCRLTEAGLKGVSARKVRFLGSNLELADLRGANLMSGSVKRSRLVQADLTLANLYGVDFYKAVLGETRLDGALLKRSLLEKGREEFFS